jgi:hypothetical protein
VKRLVVECAEGIYVLDAASDELVELQAGEQLPLRPRPLELLPAVITAGLLDVDMLGAAILVVVDRRPPLLVSHDGGATWNERGRGLKPGRWAAIGETPDEMAYAARNRVYVSTDGGVFWEALTAELPEITGLAWE